MFGRRVKGDGAKLKFYDWGATPFYALQTDQRLSYCLYVPRDYDEEGSQTYPLIVLVHGTERGAALYRDAAAEFAEAEQAIILAPLFPCNLFFVGDTENYKFLKWEETRFDLALIDMIAEVASRYRLISEKVLMHGFSGGGHFVHRFLFAHADKLLAASIGAPGVVTLLDTDKPYPLGTQGMETFLGDPLALSRVPDVAVQCVVGTDDTETWEIQVPEDSPLFVPGINDTGRTRIDRLRALADSLEAAGTDVRFDKVPGTGHDGMAVMGPVKSFFSDFIAKLRSA